MKNNIFILFIILFISLGICESGVKDSVEKYKSTTYIGNVFKEYDYIPDPINKKFKVILMNSFLFPPPVKNFEGIYETGLQFIYRTPRWVDSDLFWIRSEFGAYIKAIAYKNIIYTIGLSLNMRFDSPFYLGYNLGFLAGKYQYYYQDYNYYDDETKEYEELINGIGFEIELLLGYDISIGDWMLTPELRLSMNYISTFPDDVKIVREFAKSPIQIGLNIGRLF